MADEILQGFDSGGNPVQIKMGTVNPASPGFKRAVDYDGTQTFIGYDSGGNLYRVVPEGADLTTPGTIPAIPASEASTLLGYDVGGNKTLYDASILGGAGGAPERLARIDFEHGVHVVGETTYPVTDLLVGGGFTTDDVSVADQAGWTPVADCFPNFGSPLSIVLARTDGVIVVVDATPGVSSNEAITLVLAASDFSSYLGAVMSRSNENAIGLTTSGPTTLVSGTSIQDRRRFCLRSSPSQIAVIVTGGVEQIAVPAEGEFASWDVSQSYIETGLSSYTIHAIEFWTPDADLPALSALPEEETPANVLQLNGETLQLNGQDLTLGA